MTADTDRLFVPLNTRPYRHFESGEKDIELRGYSDRFNMQTVVIGRRVELRRGYSTDDSLWGTIESVWTIPALGPGDELMPWLDHQRILPEVTEEEFLAEMDDLLGQYGRWIGFSVSIDRLACIECGDHIEGEDDAVYGAGGLTSDGEEVVENGGSGPVSDLFAFDDGPFCSLDCLLAVGDGGEGDG